MSHMFNGATSFNQPLSTWNVINGTEMSYLFNGATAFNQPRGMCENGLQCEVCWTERCLTIRPR